MLVKTGQQFERRWCGANFVKKRGEMFVGDRLEAERRFAHFADALAPAGHMLRAEMRVQREGHFQFVNWFGGQARKEDLVLSFACVMISLQSADAFLHGEPGARGVRERAEPRKRGKIVERPIFLGAHGMEYAPANHRRKRPHGGQGKRRISRLKESFANRCGPILPWRCHYKVFYDRP